jgi:RNA polymerase sigma-70 factor (ECF subfamily)
MANDLKQTTTGDQQLVHATLSGDTSAFGIIVERYWNMVVALALGKIADPTEAEDIAQESFLKAYSQLHSLRDPSRFAGWLSKIAIQQCSNTVRRTVRRRTAFGCKATLLEDLDTKAANATNPGLTQSQVHVIRQTVGRLPEKFRTLIVMRFVAGLSAAQIAEQLGRRPGTVRVRLHRAYKILRKDLAPLLEEVRQS